MDDTTGLRTVRLGLGVYLGQLSLGALHVACSTSGREPLRFLIMPGSAFRFSCQGLGLSIRTVALVVKAKSVFVLRCPGTLGDSRRRLQINTVVQHREPMNTSMMHGPMPPR